MRAPEVHAPRGLFSEQVPELEAARAHSVVCRETWEFFFVWRTEGKIRIVRRQEDLPLPTLIKEGARSSFAEPPPNRETISCGVPRCGVNYTLAYDEQRDSRILANGLNNIDVMREKAREAISCGHALHTDKNYLWNERVMQWVAGEVFRRAAG